MTISCSIKCRENLSVRHVDSCLDEREVIKF